jgi:hypothetical protein
MSTRRISEKTINAALIERANAVWAEVVDHLLCSLKHVYEHPDREDSATQWRVCESYSSEGWAKLHMIRRIAHNLLGYSPAYDHAVDVSELLHRQIGLPLIQEFNFSRFAKEVRDEYAESIEEAA